MKRYTDNEYFFVGGYRKDTCSAENLGLIPAVYPVIGKMDSLGNVLIAHHYPLNAPQCTNIAYDLEITADKDVITWGKGSMFFAMRVDSVGALLWARYFNANGGIQFIQELPGGDLLAGMNMDTAGAVLARMTAQGDILWCKSYIRPRAMVADCLVESDDAFVVTGFTDSTTAAFINPYPPGYHPKLFMMRLNGSGEVQWCKGYENLQQTWYTRNGARIVRALDGNYVVLADLGYTNYNHWYRPLLMKTNGNGDTLWTRSNGRADYSYETVSLLAYSDGGFWYYGRIWGTMPDGTQNNWAYLYKADSLGHLPCSEQSHPVEISDLFPVDSSFTLTSVDGAIMRPAFVQDTDSLPITIYDGCTFTTAIRPMQRPSRKLSVRPNPNTGRFTMAFNDPLMAESYYSVYDATGNLLYQRPLPAGKGTEEVDLSRYGTGTYVIKCTDRDGVYHERVVLE